jgi:hypothetical protein
VSITSAEKLNSAQPSKPANASLRKKTPLSASVPPIRARTAQALVRAEQYEPPASQVREYFSKFPEFKIAPKSRDYVHEFTKLSQVANWDERRVRYERGRLQDAYAEDFNNWYGRDPDCLESWQELCRAISIPPNQIPECLDACQAVRFSQPSWSSIFTFKFLTAR